MRAPRALRPLISLSIAGALALAAGVATESFAAPKNKNAKKKSTTKPTPKPPSTSKSKKKKSKKNPPPYIPSGIVKAGLPSPLFNEDLNNGKTGLRGFVDLHTHPVAHLGFGGHLIHGAPDVDILMPAGSIYSKPSCNKTPKRATSQAEALGSCWSTHGPNNFRNNRCGNHIRRMVLNEMENGKGANKTHGVNHPQGAPGFDDWPKHDDVLHQQMWVDWMERSYKGGMRVMVALAVNNYTLAAGMETSSGNPRNDKDSADLQVAEIKRLVGRHPWMEVALTANDVRRIVGQQDKMAVIIGVEVDDIGDFVLNKANPSAETVREEIRRLHGDGVRYIFPVHLIDNLFGGTAVYENDFNRTNCYHAGHWWSLKCSDNSEEQAGIHYRVGSGIDWAQSLKLGSCGGAAPVPPCEGKGHLNTRGLATTGKALGKAALGEMMRLGMIIDIDHASLETVTGIMDFTKLPGGDYPLVSGHNGVRHGAEGNENSRTLGQYEELQRRGGIAGVGWEKMKSNEFLAALKKVKGTGVSLALGSDINGVVVQPTQRAGCSKSSPCVTYNASFPKAAMGGQEWDYNEVGVAHIGLFPDILRDLEGQPGGKTAVDALFDGAEGFAKMWERAEALRSSAPNPSLSNKIKILNASYGKNCGIETNKGNITSFVSEQCLGEASCDYEFTWKKWGGDPAPSTCKKQIEIKYKCGGSTKTVKPLHTITPQKVKLSCP